MRHPSQRLVDRITTATDKKFEPVARMADVIVDITLQHGECIPADLKAEGFTSNEVAALWHFANLLAEVELKHQGDKDMTFSQRAVRYA